MGISREYLLNIMGISWECHQNSGIEWDLMGHIIGISWDIQPTLSEMSENGDPTIGSLKNGVPVMMDLWSWCGQYSPRIVP